MKIRIASALISTAACLLLVRPVNVDAGFAPPPCSTVVVNTFDSGPGSLRDAIACAVDGDTIDATGVTGTITLISGELLIDKSLIILGPGPTGLAVDGNYPAYTNRVFNITSNHTVTIAGLTITNGFTYGLGFGFRGAGIRNDHATLTVSNCTVTGNAVGSVGGSGGGIANLGATSGAASLTVVDCTFTGRTIDGSGGAIFNDGQSGGSATLLVRNSLFKEHTASSGGAIANRGGAGFATSILHNTTFSGNSAAGYGGAIDNDSAVLQIRNCTFSDNSAVIEGGGIYDAVGLTTIGSTILNASSIANPGSSITSDGYNLSSDGTGPNNGTTDQINSDPLLGPLQDNGGPTFTHAPLCGSPAIDKGKNLSGSTTDQRGAARTFDDFNIANATGGDGTDIGAVEAPISAFTVLNTNDSGAGSLRAAISNANANAGLDIIDFAPSAYGTITLTSGELVISDCLFLNGPGATNVAVNGNAASRVFLITSGPSVTISGLTITNGTSNAGGGILNDHSTLTVNSCVVAGCSAGDGGGICSSAQDSGTADLFLINSTVAGNSAGFIGGGLFNNGIGGHAEMTLENSTVSGNSAGNSGGGIFNAGYLSSGVLTIYNCTLSDNSGGGIQSEGAGSDPFSARVFIGSTIFNNGGIGAHISDVTSLGNNLSSDDGGGFLTATGDQTNTPPLLGPLQLNGGQTPTHALLCGSPAIDAGTNFTSSATDQRGTGFPRTFGTATDIGAFEIQQVCNQVPVALCTNVTVSAGTNCMANASIDNGSYDPDAGDTITLTQDPAGPYSLGTTPVTLTVSDGTTNSTCTGTVTVEDMTNPAVTCPSNIVATNDAGQCSAVVSFTPSAGDCNGIASLTSDPASGSTFAKGTTNVTVTAVDNAGNSNTCSFTVTVVDGEAPLVACRPAANPSGKKPVPGKNGNPDVNPDGYYQVLAKDNCDANPAIYIKDTGSSDVFGPFSNGDVVRLKHAGGPAITGSTVPVLTLHGDGLAVATDADGNTTADANGCLMVVRNKSK